MSPKLPRMMIFIPMDRPTALGVREAGRTDRRLIAHAATGRLISAHGYRPDEREDADYAAQLYASITGLITAAADGDADDRADGARLVIAADVPIARVRDRTTGAGPSGRGTGPGADDHQDADYGAVTVEGLDWSDVTAVFVDEPDAGPAVRAARTAIADADDRRLAAVLDLPAVAALTDEHELLWHTPDESW